MKRILIKWVHLHLGNFISNPQFSKIFPIEHTIFIGRDPKKQIHLDFSEISNSHGSITWQVGLLASYFEYQDFSTNGSMVIHWKVFNFTSEFVKNSVAKLEPGDWIVLVSRGKDGFIVIPEIIES